MFSPCLCGFSPGALAHKYKHIRLIDDSKIDRCVVSVSFVSVWLRDGLAMCIQ